MGDGPADGGKDPGDGVALGAVAVVAMVVCCAAPALIAGGVLSSVGAFIRSPAVIVAGLAILLLGAVLALRRAR